MFSTGAGSGLTGAETDEPDFRAPRTEDLRGAARAVRRARAPVRNRFTLVDHDRPTSELARTPTPTGTTSSSYGCRRERVGPRQASLDRCRGGDDSRGGARRRPVVRRVLRRAAARVGLRREELPRDGGRARDQPDLPYRGSPSRPGVPWLPARPRRVRVAFQPLRIADGRDPPRPVASLLDGRFADALEPSVETTGPFERARTELLFGSRLARAGRAGEATDHLSAALRVFEQLGAEAWAWRARARASWPREPWRRIPRSTWWSG
jgi:hypothetical protein